MPQPIFVFAHGAGAPCDSEWMERYALGLSKLGPVHRFNYNYMASGKRAPDRLPKLIEAHVAALKSARNKFSEVAEPQMILIGKSMGGRVGCHVSLQEPVTGLICLGYPLQGTGKKRPIRDAVLRDLTTPILFAQGTRDSLCPLELLKEVRLQMSTSTRLWIVDSGDHSLLATKTWLKQHSQTQADVEAEVLAQIAGFCATL